MVLRALLLGMLPLVCAACANEPGAKVMGYQAAGHPLAISPAQAAPTGSIPPRTIPMPARKNMADKVLAAIALERVTGRKPDPSRLAEAW